MRTGDVVIAKSFTPREVVEVTEDKHGKQRVKVNQYGYKFQSEHNLLSTVGVFLFLGTYPEANGPGAVAAFAKRELRRLGWTSADDELNGER